MGGWHSDTADSGLAPQQVGSVFDPRLGGAFLCKIAVFIGLTCNFSEFLTSLLRLDIDFDALR